jgi:D-alanine-D-alanine ligase-like ATP-grasp enzyme
MGLAVAGIDLRRTPEGQWYCFEVNPSPGFTYFQAQAGQAIDQAIAQLLLQAPGRHC